MACSLLSRSSEGHGSILLAVVFLILPGCKSETPTDNSSPSFQHFTAFPIDGDAETLIADAAKDAHSLQLKPFVYFTATWCGPCQAIKHSMDDPRMKAAFAGTYIIAFDLDEWSEFPDGFDASSIPMYYEIDEAGQPSGRKIGGDAWGENIPENMAPPLSAFFHGE